jgi:hypothetical protein
MLEPLNTVKEQQVLLEVSIVVWHKMFVKKGNDILECAQQQTEHIMDFNQAPNNFYLVLICSCGLFSTSHHHVLHN